MHLFRSFLVHLLVIGIILTVLFFGTRHFEKKTQIAIEAVSIHNPVKIKSVSTESVTAKSESNHVEIGEVSPSEIQKYLSEISNRINRVKKYPESARMSEQEGVVEVLLEVAPDGRILHTEISKPSAYEVLNQAAIKAIQELGVLPPLPGMEPLHLRIPIQFQLQ